MPAENWATALTSAHPAGLSNQREQVDLSRSTDVQYVDKDAIDITIHIL